MTPDQALREAIALSLAAARKDDGGPFGAVVVHGGRLVGRGWNRVLADADPTAHAEMVALREAARTLGSHQLAGAVLYSSCEPCPMCLAAAWWARVEGVVFGNSRHDAAAIGFDDATLYEELARPLEARRLPSRQRLREVAQEAFRVWHARPDKVVY